MAGAPAINFSSGMKDSEALEFVDSGSWVWYKHDTLAWAACKVRKGGRDVELENGETHEIYSAPANRCHPMHESSLRPVPNLVELADLNEASVLHCLRARYTNGEDFDGVKCDTQMFTYIGPILIYINPYKHLPIFTPELVKTYYQVRDDMQEKLPPHIYEVVNETYLQMRKENGAQGMVISGESGAGKTEATKICLNFLATVAGSTGDDSPTQLLLDSSPIMESFGNAKTIRNNNSSRFGKYMEVHFQDEGERSVIVGGVIKKYLLEKSRIVWQAAGERNFHILIEVFDLPAELKAKYALTKPEDFHYINQGGSIRAEGWDDKEELGLVMAAFKRLGIAAEEIFDIVAAVLWIGQTKFLGRGQDTAVTIEDSAPIHRAAQLLGLDEAAFAKTLTTRLIRTRGETVTATLNHEQACAARDGISKQIYENLFDHITASINKGIDRVRTAEKGPQTTGVLDIFGFECFAVNSFEQLCINYTNEKLQFHFNAHIFLLEMKIYKQEGLDVGKITFRDNQGCLDLIEMKRTGVMAMIEEEIYVPQGTDHTMVEKMHTQNYGYNDFYAKPVVRGGRAASGSSLTPQEGFIIKHYAGPVPYKADGFLEKCKDRLPADSEELLKNSTNPLIKQFFKDAQGWSDGKGGGRPATLGGKFKNSMQELYDMLDATSPHFIKCVKPNTVKRNVFDSNFTLYQLTYLGLLEVIRIRKSGYPVRVPHNEFVGRYRLLEENPDHWPDSTDICRDHGIDGDWQIGATMVFMRDVMYSHLETNRARMLDKRIRGLQAWMVEELKRRTWTSKKKGFVSLQAHARGSAARKRVARLRLEVDCERKCEEGVTQRKLEPLEFAIAEAKRISHTFPLLLEAQAILDRLKDEKEVEEMLTYAVKAKDSAELERSLKAATQLGLEALWHGLDESDPRKELIPRCRTLIEQLSRYDELMSGLNSAMRERTVEALKAMILECESVELECGEVEEAREMLKMAEFEQSARRLRLEKRQRQIEAQWTKPKQTEPVAQPNAALLEEQATMQRRIREFEHALTAATENGEAFPGELQRLEAKIAECKQQLQSEAMKEEERRQRIEREKAELELAKREAARKAEVRTLCAAMVPGIRIAMGTYRAENLEAIVTKVTARLGAEASNSLELGLAQDVLNEMKLAKKHATEAEVAPVLAAAIETGKAMTGKTHAVKIKGLVVALGMALSSGVHSVAVTQARQLAVDVLDAWQMTAMLNHATLLGRKTMLATVLQRAHEQEGFTKYAGTEGRDAMSRALHRVKEDGIDVASVPAASKQLNDLAVRTQGGQVVVHFLDGRTETFANRITLQEAIETIAVKYKLARASDYGIYQTTRMGTGERLLSCGGGEQLTLGQVCQEWLAQATHYAELMGSKLKGDSAALGDAKFNYRFFFGRKLIFGDSLSTGNPGDTDELYWYSRKRVENGTYRTTEDDVLTLASLRLQVEKGDHHPINTALAIKPVLSDYIPQHLKKAQPAKEWLEDLCATHSQMNGFEAVACKENYIRITMGFDNFGYTCYPLRKVVDPRKPHLSEKVVIGVNYRGLGLFDENNQCYISYPYLELDDVTVSKTRLHIALCNDDNLWFQADIAAAREIGALLEAYREKLPRKRKSNVQLRSVPTSDDGLHGESEEGEKENTDAAADADQNDGTAVFKQQFPVALKEPPPGMTPFDSKVSEAPEAEPAANPPPSVDMAATSAARPPGALFDAPAAQQQGAKKKSSGGLFEDSEGDAEGLFGARLKIDSGGGGLFD